IRSASGRRALLWVFTFVLVGALAASTAFWNLKPSSQAKAATESPLIRFTIPPPKDSAFHGTIAISPDGKKIAFVATSALWVQRLDSTEAQRLPGTEEASYPFWSPDSRFIAYFARGKLRKIDSSGGTPQIICDASDGRGGSWGSKGMILFSPTSTSGLYRISAEGGTAELQTAKSGINLRWPVFLPDGKHFLYVRAGEPETGIFAGSLESKESRRLL